MANDRDALFEKKTQALVSLSVGFIFIFIGIPLWWNTTKVYRASLPYSQIEELNHLKVSYSTHINVILLGDQDSDVLKEEIEKGLNKGGELSTTVAEYRVTVLKKSCEDALLHNLKISSLEDLDEFFLTSSLLNMDGQHYSFIVLPHNHPDSSTVDLFVGKYLHCIMYDNKDLRKLASMISSVTKNVYVNEVAVSRAFSLTSNRQVTSVKDTPESMRGQKSTTGFQVSFTLLNSDPQSVIPEWDIEAAIQKYLDPFLQKFPHLDISVDSQVLHYSSVKITPKKSGETFYLPYDDLPHMINPIEAKLGSHISLYPSLNFIVYIPAQGQSPLYMRTKDDEKSATNAFLSPQWGGLMIYNVQKAAEGDNSTQHITVNMKSVMSVFISQLKLLLGVLPVEPEEGVLIRHGRDVGVTRWEQDMVMRVKTMEYLATSTITLTSLAQLLSEISNMVINDNIQQQVEQALHAIYQSTAALRRGDLSRAVFTARKAIKSSEEAFFDPSILELLYFPDDQKYAIYIPLFLPIGLPILLSLRQAINWYRGKTDSEDDTDKQKSKQQ